ncbi:type IV secretion system protein VirD4 [Rhodobium orientis]|uniref:Type IV secretion system protein VirD4 n=1 Tax=Rhodobium orientis TaxID=34017 RepID=A0A327JN63_9HYPH|nr:type IV secretory system conjugative DNA transfer family protein [Rhodobium orientis]MBB4305124.1 type IV secretion system protein VirD4 [Rhodobium orientis]MBK5950899.1 type IV secretion system protein VirD4 [Rhodobium orientis]RAI27016.1 type IV secretion system protein VirD4 [Rhodobium orientis]
MAQIVRRIIGLSHDSQPIYAPKHAHSLLLSAAGGGKTTCGAVPWLQSLIADHARAIVIADSKEGEIAAQCAGMCVKHGRKVAIVDDFGVLGLDNPHRISLNRFGAVIASHVKENGELIFSTENATQALIEEPPRDQRNAYWRDCPRSLIEFALSTLLVRNPRLATPGGVWSLLSDPEMLLAMARIEAEEGDEALQALARDVIGMGANEEHFPQHRTAALKSVRIYGAGSALHTVGVAATHSHERLLREKFVIFLAGPVRHMERLGADYALQLQSFVEVVLSGNAPPVSFILDEFTNAPLKALISQLTTMRGYGGTCHLIAQSRSEIERKYGDKETATIDENAVIKQWFGFSSIKEAEHVSRAMGEALAVSRSIGVNSDRDAFSGTINISKERLFTPDELMRLPTDEQIIHVKDVGWIHAKKIGQHQIAPYCFDLQRNPLEGGILPADPKITLDPTPQNTDPEDDGGDMS